MLKTCHLFAGAGGGLLADLILGHTPIVAVEWDAYACQVLRERAADGWFPGLHVHEGDVRLFDPSEYAGRVDCIAAGFPCQDLSVAGNQAGLGEGTRSGLYREVLRIAGVVRPRYLFLENVSAILTGGLGTVLGDLAARGYDCRWCCLEASGVGAPHRRDRWWLFAKRTDSDRDQSGTSGMGQNTGTNRRNDSERLGTVADTSSGRFSGENARQGEHPGRAEAIGASEVVADSCINGRNHISRIYKHFSDAGRPLLEERTTGERDGWWGTVEQHGGDVAHSIGGSDGAEIKRGEADRPGENGPASRAGGPGWWESEPDLGLLAPRMATEPLPGWWEIEPDIGRVSTGVKNRAKQLKALGNGQVPIQAATAWKILGGP